MSERSDRIEKRIHEILLINSVAYGETTEEAIRAISVAIADELDAPEVTEAERSSNPEGSSGKFYNLRGRDSLFSRAKLAQAPGTKNAAEGTCVRAPVPVTPAAAKARSFLPKTRSEKPNSKS